MKTTHQVSSIQESFSVQIILDVMNFCVLPNSFLVLSVSHMNLDLFLLQGQAEDKEVQHLGGKHQGYGWWR